MVKVIEFPICRRQKDQLERDAIEADNDFFFPFPVRFITPLKIRASKLSLVLEVEVPCHNR
jgi:hypothetical protein